MVQRTIKMQNDTTDRHPSQSLLRPVTRPVREGGEGSNSPSSQPVCFVGRSLTALQNNKVKIKINNNVKQANNTIL